MSFHRYRKDKPEAAPAEKNRAEATGESQSRDRFQALRHAARNVKPAAPKDTSKTMTDAKRGAAAAFAKGK